MSTTRRQAGSPGVKRAAPRGASKPAPGSARRRALRINHKSPEAVQARVELDARTLAFVKQNAKHGVSRAEAAEALGEDPVVVKASLTRLCRRGKVSTRGERVLTRYFPCKVPARRASL